MIIKMLMVIWHAERERERKKENILKEHIKIKYTSET
jgi:hypothetical protein